MVTFGENWSLLAETGAAPADLKSKGRWRLVVMQGASTEPPLQQGQLPKRALRSARSRTMLQHKSVQGFSGEEVRSPHPNDQAERGPKACSYDSDNMYVYIHMFMSCTCMH